MDYNWVWETIAIFFIGKVILRIGGRKSISQMTITQTIVMIGIGSLLIQPIAGKNVWKTLAIALIFTLLMVFSEYLEIKFDIMESLFSGKAVIVIENGEIDYKNLKKLRLTVDRLETRLRQNGVSSIKDVKTATLEVSGQIGYELKEDKKPLTKEDFIIIMSEIENKSQINQGIQNTKKDNTDNIFQEVINKSKEGKNEPSV
ncbi:DUF421 domain-containing protein [Anaerosacchariphilus polymeriproducens]|uniref:DUF421 domain-containing protein n=1 Tax=Anaerosacchariphilus polymeriproducens TaxID=1812858 RepID=A0A371AZD7_9FIRM|nr:DUF421 domain-containing protein [Anaerosacchariphilus polymeriproducens]RDU24916.1 DUF421 domain-containing protein [Anaerosacchariphilus polymeriproducens]